MKHILAIGPFESSPRGCAPCSCSRPLSQLAAVVLAWSLMGVSSLPAQQPKATAYEVKAAYLYNFGKFVQWPAKITAGNNEPFTICVLGKDPFGASLDATIAGEAIDGRSVLAKRLSKPQEALNCRVLFISSSEDAQLKEILATLEKTSVLTVSDVSQFTRRGGMIQFVEDDPRPFHYQETHAHEHAGERCRPVAGVPGFWCLRCARVSTGHSA